MATKKKERTPSGALPFTVPGMRGGEAHEVIEILQGRLDALNDLALTLKHAHWNVVGPHFIAIHQMLDPQVAAVRLMADATAERIAALGGEPVGTAGALVAARDWEDYPVRRGYAFDHLGALDTVYARVVKAHRDAIDKTEKPDPVTQDMLIEQAGQLEQFHWFVRAHLEHADGTLETVVSHDGARATGSSGSNRRSA